MFWKFELFDLSGFIWNIKKVEYLPNISHKCTIKRLELKKLINLQADEFNIGGAC